MKEVFADTSYWIALLIPKDDHSAKAVELTKGLGLFKLITSEIVLAEYLNFITAKANFLRTAAAESVEALSKRAHVEIIPLTRDLFQNALALYKQRQDKAYSFTDCASFSIMEDRKISDALTTDKHFMQEGFKALLR